MSAPSDYEFSSLTNDVDVATLENQEKIVYSTIKVGKKPLRVVLRGELATDGINSKAFGNNVTYSFGLKLADEADTSALNSIISDLIAVEEYETKPIVQDDDRMFIKLPVAKSGLKFSTKINIKYDFKKLDEIDLYRGQDVEVYADVGAWYNIVDGKPTAGMMLKATKVEFVQDEPAKKKKKE